MSVLKTGNTARIIRDYLYDKTGPAVVLPAGLTVAEVTEALTAIRSRRGVSPGAVRRTLNELTRQNLLILDDRANPPVYKWHPTAAKPVDHLRRAVLQTLQASPGSPMVTPLTEAEQRENLSWLIEDRINEITGGETTTVEEKTPKPRKPSSKGIRRVNGQVYQPRELAGGSDVTALRRLREKSIFALLSGPPGTGKTVLVDAAFGENGLHTVTADENTSVDDFLGQWSPDGEGGYVWVDGPLINAMRGGEVLFIDDATLANPKVLAVVYPAMDGRGEITVKSHIINGHPDIVTAQPGFYVVAAHNPGVHGAILTDALASRFTARIWVETDLALAAALGVTDKAVKLVRNLRIDREKGQANIWTPQLRELLAYRDIAALFGEKVAAANLLGMAPEEDQGWVQDRMRGIWGEEILPLEIGGQL